MVNIFGNNRFEIPSYISHDYNYILGRFVKYISPESLEQVLCTGASIPVENSLFNNRASLYVLSWDENSRSYNGNIVDTNDITQFSFIYMEIVFLVVKYLK